MSQSPSPVVCRHGAKCRFQLQCRYHHDPLTRWMWKHYHVLRSIKTALEFKDYKTQKCKYNLKCKHQSTTCRFAHPLLLVVPYAPQPVATSLMYDGWCRRCGHSGHTVDMCSAPIKLDLA